MQDTIAVILAAGLGTRMKSARPKALFEVAGLPLVAYPIRAALAAGVGRVAVVVGHQADAVRARITALFPDADIAFVTQAEQRGTAHATRCAADVAAPWRNVLLMNGDLPLLTADTVATLRAAFDASGGTFALLTSVVDDPGGFGRIVRDDAGAVRRIVERRDATPRELAIREVNVGLYLAEDAALFRDLEAVDDANRVHEFYFTDVVRMRADAGQAVGVHVLPDPGEAAQVNDRAELAVVEAAMLRRNARALMAGGVTIHLPDTVAIDTDCDVGPDTEIGPGVELHGATRIGAGCTVGRGCVLTNVVVGDGVTIKPYCVMTDAHVANGAVLGPFAHLRPGADVGPDAHVGNFVEMKKATLGPGSKANHLTYLGDCTVGRGVNIGAGTITCNYDGVNKLPTVIEDGAFIGSDTQLVAPVRVGKDAYIAAGTTVTKDVPDGALALSRVPQTHVEGYAARRPRRKS